MSLLGDGMLVRLRSASIALFGLATVVGLGLIVFIAQLGFPGVFISPIPGDSSKAGSVDDAIALVQSGGIDSPAPRRGERGAATVHAHRGARSPVDAGLGDSRSLVASQPSPAVTPPPTSPDPVPEPEPAGQPVTPAAVSSPSPTPAPDSTTVSVPKPSSESQSKKTSSSKSKSKSKTSGSVSSKTKSKPEAASTGKSKGHQASKGASYTPSSKSNDDSSDKAGEEEIAPPSKTTVPAPVESKTKQDSEAPEKSADKESFDSGKSDKYRH